MVRILRHSGDTEATPQLLIRNELHRRIDRQRNVLQPGPASLPRLTMVATHQHPAGRAEYDPPPTPRNDTATPEGMERWTGDEVALSRKRHLGEDTGPSLGGADDEEGGQTLAIRDRCGRGYLVIGRNRGRRAPGQPSITGDLQAATGDAYGQIWPDGQRQQISDALNDLPRRAAVCGPVEWVVRCFCASTGGARASQEKHVVSGNGDARRRGWGADHLPGRPVVARPIESLAAHDVQ